jgi:hypothetical protein
MTVESSKQKILQMVSEGRISPEDGDELLAALEAKPKINWPFLFNPFERIGVGVSLLFAALACLAGLGLSRFHIRFDGTLDTHININKDVLFTHALLDQAAIWLLTALVFWVIALVMKRPGRFVDFFAYMGLSRLPKVLEGSIVALMYSEGFARIASERVVSFIQLFGIFFDFPLLGWYIVLLYQSYKTASGLKGNPLVVSFIIGLAAAETASKLLLFAFHTIR